MSEKSLAQKIREHSWKFADDLKAALPRDAVELTVSIEVQAVLALYEIAAQLATMNERAEKSNA